MSGSKGSREKHRTGKFRKDVRRRKIPPKNPRTAKRETASTSTASKKFRIAHDVPVPEEETIGYRLLNFITVFSAVKVSGEINFKAGGTGGLGFKIMIICENCDPISIFSCPLISSGFEINRRFFFALRLLGIGLGGGKKFCGIIDLPPPVAHKSYDAMLRISIGLKSSHGEREAPGKEGLNDTEFTVSGDGSWKKRGFTSLLGLASLIGWYTGKVLDVLVKSFFCKSCEYLEDKVGSAEYEEWKEEHDSKGTANHTGCAGKIEVDAIVKMFSRYEERYGIKYVNYIGDGDSKTYKGVLDAKPYGDVFVINKIECIGRVQKSMGTRLQLTAEALLQRCFGGYTQNNNGSLHSLIWKISPKEIHSGVVVGEIVANIAICIFNEGNVTLLKVILVMGGKYGKNAHPWAVLEDAGRLSRAEYTAMSSTREGRAAKRGKWRK
ncbi:hypothetical protein J437_LFUL004743 [Ladona fulva]|uniref:Mutator-like transposase domain-containing protein n=1 Tax=Ladona fulva TaxID=123851 RepID=A0A8K0K2E3_LADFU|nr:hypothetical protein J437_LFUL004743 [Ladona fulva]